ncbi:hypothetical protein [Idiomarina xiamenensis]|uniref:Signal transduction histidine Kinases (STHK) n=1 Tax=Idiomarina xiamenensis 10-D-4 TaxID=740709 RepID=K2KC73_9GAMM|nr:hypothetical protein [Idiomarina xiamenensis]EKE84192.1 Signal transduction histidine Kinases (STHK) [Idiomarina xiamenensis 10-D-4]
MRVSLTARLVGVVLVMQSLLLGAVLVYLFMFNPPVLIRYIMHEQLSLFSDNVFLDEDGQPQVRISEETDNSVWIYAVLPYDLIYQIIDRQGRVAFSSVPVAAFAPATGDSSAQPKSFYYTLQQRNFYVERMQLSGELADYRLQVATSERMLALFQLTRIQPLSKFALLLIIFSILLYVLIVILTVRRMLKPLLRVAAAAQQI